MTPWKNGKTKEEKQKPKNTTGGEKQTAYGVNKRQKKKTEGKNALREKKHPSMVSLFKNGLPRRGRARERVKMVLLRNFEKFTSLEMALNASWRYK